MKPSRYNIASENPETGELVLFNSLYGSTIAIPAERKNHVLGLIEAPAASSNETDANLIGKLAHLKFVVGDDVDELQIVQQRKIAGMHDKNRLDVILMPNMDCNFSCPYCYEKHDSAKRMTSEVSARIVRWLALRIPHQKVVFLGWFGGEPLLSPETVLDIGGFVREACRSHGVRLITNVTTNGYALTPRLIERLLAADMFDYQITVDGPPEAHNRTRVLRSGKGSFDRVFGNILSLARADSRARISLRVNYNHENIHEIPGLLEMFPADIRSQLRIVFEPVFGDAKLSATKNLSGEEIARTITADYALAGRLGYDVRLGTLGVGRLVYCYAERQNQYIIDFKGDVFKCSVTDFSSSCKIGSIDAEGMLVRDEANWKAWMDMPPFDDSCTECVFLPLCMGGCRKDRAEHGGTGSYCSLVPTNTSHALKAVAFGNFKELLGQTVHKEHNCSKGRQSGTNCQSFT